MKQLKNRSLPSYNPIELADQLSGDVNKSKLNSIFKQVSNGRTNSHDFSLGIEIGFGSWDNTLNQVLSHHILKNYPRQSVALASGVELGETIAEALLQKNPTNLRAYQSMMTDVAITEG